MALTKTLSRLLSKGGLKFVSSRTRLGPLHFATGLHSATYQHSILSRDMPPCAWREPPEGGIHVIAIGATFEEALPAMRRVEEAYASGKRVEGIFWPVRAIRGGSFHLKRVPTLVERGPAGLSFAPMALGTASIRVPSTRMREFLMGDRASDPPNVPEASLPHNAATHERLLIAARASGVLNRAERFQAAVGIALARCKQASIDGISLVRIRTALEMLQEGLAPVVEGEEADAAHLERAHAAIEALVAHDLATKFGRAGELFLSTEVGPLLALAEARKRVAAAERVAGAGAPSMALA